MTAPSEGLTLQKQPQKIVVIIENNQRSSSIIMIKQVNYELYSNGGVLFYY